MKKTFAILAVLVLFAISLPTTVFSYSLADDWSNSVNPNGTWSYNQGSTPLSSTIAGWPVNEFGAGQTAWADGSSAPNLVPGWMKSLSTPGGDFDWLAGDVIVHSTDSWSGGTNGLANVTWTAPITGTFSVTGGLWSGRDALGRGNDWSLFLNTTLLDSGSLFVGDGFSRATPDTFSYSGLFAAGDVLKLQIAKTSEYGDFVGTNLNLTVTPEPVAMALFLIGGVPIGVSLYRKRKKGVRV